MKRIISLGLALLFGKKLLDKTHVKKPEQILKKAVRKHGACTYVSEEKRNGRVYVTVHDRLQDFDYTLCSAMTEYGMDGSTFFHLENTTDDFEKRLRSHILSQIKPELDAVLAQYGASLDNRADFSSYYLNVRVPDGQYAEAVCLQCAQLLQKHNLKNRLDRKVIAAETAPRTHAGSVTLPEMCFLDCEGETVRWVTDHVKRMTEAQDIRFLRKESHTLAELGCPPDRVSCTAGSYYPKKPEDFVDCYLFEIGGRELLTAHFFDNQTGNLFCNWKE